MKPIKLEKKPTQKGRAKGRQRTRAALANKPTCTISATQAARTFSDLLNRVHYRGDTFVIERGGEPVCQIIPARPVARTVADFVQLLRSIPKPDDEYWDILEDITKHQPPLPKSPWPR